MSKMITSLNPSNPANHAGTTTPQISIHTPGGAASATTWALGTDATTGAYYADYLVNSFSGGGGGSGFNLPGPLPAFEVLFDGENQGNMNLLYWTLTKEVNVSHYEIERSSLENGLFSMVGQVEAQQLTQYAFPDNSPIIGNNYYRLKIVDTDGSIAYSNTIKISNFPYGFAYKLFPNPTKNEVNLELQTLGRSELTFILYDEIGHEVLKKTWTDTGNINAVLEVRNLSRGVYLYRLFDDKNRYEGKLIKE